MTLGSGHRSVGWEGSGNFQKLEGWTGMEQEEVKRRVAVEGRALGSVSKANLADEKGRMPLFLERIREPF